MRLRGLLFGLVFAFGCESEPKPSSDDDVRFFDDTGTQVIDDTGTSGDDTASNGDLDSDGDGFPASEDCDDNDPTSYPGAEEICDGADNNCDGAVDEGLTETWYPDSDGDGYGASASPIEACTQPVGTTADGSDCDDEDSDVNPDGVEVCDGADNDCNGDTDGEDAMGQSIFYADADSDGYGDELVTVEACWATEGFTDGAGGFDCDDLEPTVNPGAEEICDDLDNNCDGVADGADATDASEWYLDADGDEFGDPWTPSVSCRPAAGYIEDGTDCDDTTAFANPDAEETCNGFDDDCDGSIDDGFDLEAYYRDADGDGHGDPLDMVFRCSRPAGYVVLSDDCDDSDYWVNPGLTEMCDEKDNDCDGDVDEEVVYVMFYLDSDSDGYGSMTDAGISACSPPGGRVVDQSDCDDSDGEINPGAIETCNEADDDCNGEVDEGLPVYTYFFDEDVDGYGVPDTTTDHCRLLSGWSEVDTDCDDLEYTTRPGAYEMCDEIDNDCNGLVDDDCGSSPILGRYATALCESSPADITAEGDYLQATFNNHGTWVGTTGGVGIGDGTGDEYHECVRYGAFWQLVAFEWMEGTTARAFQGNKSGGHTWTTNCGDDLADGVVAGVIHEWEMATLVITKTEIWDLEGQVSRVWFDVENTGSADVSDLRTMWGIDPDHDYDFGGSFPTLNDTREDGSYVESVGSSGGYTLAFGVCDPETQDLGHTGWSTDTDVAFVDDEGGSADRTMHWRQLGLDVPAGGTASYGFLITFGPDEESPETTYDENFDILCSGI